MTSSQHITSPYSASFLPPPPGAHDAAAQTLLPSYYNPYAAASGADMHAGGSYSAAAAYNNYYTYHASMSDPYFPFSVTFQHLGKVRSTLSGAHLTSRTQDLKGVSSYHPYAALNRSQTGTGVCQRTHDVTSGVTSTSCVGASGSQLFSSY